MSARVSRLQVLEKQFQSEPESEQVLKAILSEFMGEPNLWTDPRRAKYISDYVALFPKESIARTPLVHLSPAICPKSWLEVEQRWVIHMEKSPNDSAISRGFALFLAAKDKEQAMAILHRALEALPRDANLYTDLGRISSDPNKRSEYFEQAINLRGTNPNLLVWFARAAADAGLVDKAEKASTLLLERAAELHSLYGDLLYCDKKTSERWTWAKAQSIDVGKARDLVKAISNYANSKHWGHTISGLVSLRRLDHDRALKHLRASSSVVAEPRLSSYGPSFRLAGELLTLNQWAAVEEYLQACRTFWKDDRIQGWLSELSARQHPHFPDQ